MIYEDAGAIKAMDRRDNPPGMHTRPRRPSNYGKALMEKQKIKHFYGLGERQLRRYFTNVSRKKGNTGELLLLLCETRLDNVIRRAGFTKTRPQARQGIAHGHFFVNGVKVTSPSYQVRSGDVISIRDKTGIRNLYQFASSESAGEPSEWVAFDSEGLTATVQSTPDAADISLTIDINMVVEFLSR